MSKIEHSDFIGPVQPIWERCKFPTMDINVDNGHGDRWFAARATMHNPKCWTPTKPFYFGGERFIPLYPCAAWATANFGWVCQQGPDGMILGKF